jgi:Tol biopolymer transport system component
MKKLYQLLLIIIIILSNKNMLSQEIPDGPYLGQTPPGAEPEIFAAGIVSEENRGESHPVFTHDGNGFYFRSGPSMFTIQQVDGHWTGPDSYSFFGYQTVEPFFTLDGLELFFQRGGNIYLSEKDGTEWGDPVKINYPVSSCSTEWYPTVSNIGTIYFTSNRSGGYGDMDIYSAELTMGQYLTATNLGNAINTSYGEYDPIIAPNDSFIIFSSSRPGDYGTWDIYISFKRQDNSWTEATDMGAVINEGDGGAWSIKLSPDSKYLLFARGSGDGYSDIYWCNTEIIDSLKLNELNKYFGQTPPGNTPEIFAPEIVSLEDRYEDQGVFSPDGREFYITVYNNDYSESDIYYTKMENGIWTEPIIAPFADVSNNRELAFSPDGKKAFFGSTRSPGSPPWNDDIFMTERTDSADGWTEPVHPGEIINSSFSDGGPSIASNGNLYFSSDRNGGSGNSDIYVAKLTDSVYSTVKNLGDSVNTAGAEWCTCIAPDESYIVFEGGGYADSYGKTDLYVSFRKQDSTWTKPINLGSTMNSSEIDECPVISADGKYLFFGSRRSGLADIYWVDAGIIEQLRPYDKISYIHAGKEPENMVNIYPNPFKESTTITYSVYASTYACLKVYNSLGKEIKTLCNKFHNKGTYSIEFRKEYLSKGIYFIKFQAGDKATIRKLILH